MIRLASIKIISYLWLGSVLGAGCAFVTQVILARELNPADFGTLAAALGMVTLVAPLASFGVGGFWLKSFGQEGWQARRWLRASLKYALATTSLVLVALWIWGGVGPHDASTRSLLLVLSSYLLGLVTVEMVSAKLQLEERYVELAIWQFFPHFLRLLLVLILVFITVKSVTPWGVACAYSIISFGVFIYGMSSLWRLYCGNLDLQGHGKVRGGFNITNVSPSIIAVAAQSWPFGLAGVFYLIYFQSDVILLKYISGDEAAGQYNVAFVIMAAVYLLPSVIYQKFLLPKIHRWANHDREQFYRIYRTGNLIMLLLGLLAMLMIWVLAPWGVPLFFSSSYMEAIIPLNILALAAPIRFVATSVGSTLATRQHMKKKVWYMAFTAILNIFLNILLIPEYGIVGAAIATVVSDAALLILYVYSAKYHVFFKGSLNVR